MNPRKRLRLNNIRPTQYTKLTAYQYIQILALVIVSIIYLGIKAVSQIKKAPGKSESFYVTRVVDGDTLKLSNGRKVRLIGVDTPELHYSDKLLRDARRTKRDIKTIQAFGKRAADFTKDLCLDKKIRLEFDVEKRDRYGRLLAYVYLDDGTFVNAKILEEGFGQVMTIPPNVKYAGLFTRLQKDSRVNRRGLWKDEASLDK